MFAGVETLETGSNPEPNPESADPPVKDSPTVTQGVASVAVGAAKGAKAGGAAGAALGAVKAGAVALLRHRRGRWVLAALAAVSPIGILVIVMVMVTLLTSSAVGGWAGIRANQSSGIVVEDGLNAKDLPVIIEAAQADGLPWQLVGSVMFRQRDQVGGVGPLHVLDTVAGAPSSDDVKVNARWISGKIRDAAESTDGLSLGTDIATYGRVSTTLSVDFPDLEQHEKRIREPWIKALGTLPLMGVDSTWAGQVIDQAIYWRLGVSGLGVGGACLGATSGVAPEAISLNPDQQLVAKTIIAAGRALKVSDQGIVISLMTAFQESTMRNLSGGDRDSLGPFQQRPSQGWGTPEQIRDVTKATQAFMGRASHTNNTGLLDLRGWESMAPGDAAQKVQRSGFPDAYAKWEANARWVLANLGTGAGSVAADEAAMACGAMEAANCPPSGLPVEKGLTPDAVLVLRCLHGQFPLFNPFYGVGGTQDHLVGRAVDAMVPNYKLPANIATGTQAAQWTMDHHRELGVKYVIWRQRIWNATFEDPKPWTSWRTMEDRGSDTQNHMDHVHVSVFGSSATGFADAAVSVGPGAWTLPIKKGQYVITSPFNPSRYHPILHIYRPHNGVDFASIGNPARPTMYAIATGKVTFAGNCGGCGFGNLVQIDTGTLIMKYAHLNDISPSLRVGQTIPAGTAIGHMGTTGLSTGTHLHLEFWSKGTPIDPIPVMRSKGLSP